LGGDKILYHLWAIASFFYRFGMIGAPQFRAVAGGKAIDKRRVWVETPLQAFAPCARTCFLCGSI
jgi:hypothetical protein